MTKKFTTIAEAQWQYKPNSNHRITGVRSDELYTGGF
jgi:hypothetical protein